LDNNILFGNNFSYDSSLLENSSPLVKLSPLFYGKIICVFLMRERPEGLAQKVTEVYGKSSRRILTVKIHL